MTSFSSSNADSKGITGLLKKKKKNNAYMFNEESQPDGPQRVAEQNSSVTQEVKWA